LLETQAKDDSVRVSVTSAMLFWTTFLYEGLAVGDYMHA